MDLLPPDLTLIRSVPTNALVLAYMGACLEPSGVATVTFATMAGSTLAWRGHVTDPPRPIAAVGKEAASRHNLLRSCNQAVHVIAELGLALPLTGPG